MALAEFIILFREMFEIVFVIGIMVVYLHKTKNNQYIGFIYGGALAGIILSICLAYAFQFSMDVFENYEEIFEGIFMIIASVFVTWMTLWIIKQKHIAEKIRDDVKINLEKGEVIGLFLLSLVSVFREAVEIVLFLAGLFLTTGTVSLAGGLIGAVAAITVCILFFRYAIKFDLGLFFKATAAMLVLLAAGLFSQGIHELQEAGVLPTFIEHVYDFGFKQNEDGAYPLLHEKGIIGGTLKGLVGYDTNPSDLQIIGYLMYVGGAYVYYVIQKN